MTTNSSQTTTMSPEQKIWHERGEKCPNRTALAAEAAALRAALQWLWGFYDGNTLNAKPGYEEDIAVAWEGIWESLDLITEDVAVLERRLTLMPCGHPRECVAGSGDPDCSTGHCEWCADLAEQQAEIYKLISANEDLENRLARAEADQIAACENCDLLNSISSMLTAAGITKGDDEKWPASEHSRVAIALNRMARAEALAALVPSASLITIAVAAMELVAMMAAQFGNSDYSNVVADGAEEARALAARIEEARGEGQEDER